MYNYESGSEDSDSENEVDSDIEGMLYSQIHYGSNSYVELETKSELFVEQRKVEHIVNVEFEANKNDKEIVNCFSNSDEEVVEVKEVERNFVNTDGEEVITIKSPFYERLNFLKRIRAVSSSSEDSEDVEVDEEELNVSNLYAHIRDGNQPENEKVNKDTRPSKLMKRKKTQEEKSKRKKDKDGISKKKKDKNGISKKKQKYQHEQTKDESEKDDGKSKSKKKRKREVELTKSKDLSGEELLNACHEAMTKFYSTDFCVFPRNIKGKSKWTLLSSDLKPPVKRGKRSRFFDVCDTCNETGHDTRDCPVARANMKCKYCGEGHDMSACHNLRCNICWGVGHKMNKCPSKNKGKITCNRCRRWGHFTDQCSDIWRQFHSTTEPGMTKKIIGRGMMNYETSYCFNCGCKGHLGFMCKMSRIGFVLPYFPYVSFYEDFNENRDEGKTWPSHKNFEEEHRGESYCESPKGNCSAVKMFPRHKKFEENHNEQHGAGSYYESPKGNRYADKIRPRRGRFENGLDKQRRAGSRYEKPKRNRFADEVRSRHKRFKVNHNEYDASPDLTYKPEIAVSKKKSENELQRAIIGWENVFNATCTYTSMNQKMRKIEEGSMNCKENGEPKNDKKNKKE